MKKILEKISYSRLLFSILFAIAIFFMTKIIFLGYVYYENDIKQINLIEFTIILFLIPIIYFSMYILEKFYKKLIKYTISKSSFKLKLFICIVSFIILLTVYLLYYLSFYPGGIYIDTWTSLMMLNGTEDFTNHQPVLYTLSLNLVNAFSPDLITGFGIFTFIQILFMVTTITYFLYWLLNKNIHPVIVSLIGIFFAIFKLYPLYSISIWKDTPFSLVLFLLTLTTIDLIFDFNNKKLNKCNIIKFNIFSMLVMLLRNNGIYIVIATFIILLFTYRKLILKERNIENIKLFTITSIFTIILIIIIQSLYPKFGIKQTEFVENVGIPIQQIARVVATNGKITDEQMKLIENVLPEQDIKNDYHPMIVDSMKWHPNFNEQYLNEHKGDYLRLWIELFIQNPSEYIKAYLLQTSGFWSFNVKGPEAYISAQIWPTLTSDLQNKDLISKLTHISLTSILLPKTYLSSGFFLWIMLISILITYRISSKKYLIGYLPCFLLWLTIMIATPIATSLRYAFVLVLILPLNFIYPAIVKYENDKCEKGPNK